LFGIKIPSGMVSASPPTAIPEIHITRNGRSLYLQCIPTKFTQSVRKHGPNAKIPHLEPRYCKPLLTWKILSRMNILSTGLFSHTFIFTHIYWIYSGNS